MIREAVAAQSGWLVYPVAPLAFMALMLVGPHLIFFLMFFFGVWLGLTKLLAD